ncbi:MAG: glutaminyl-peptide cyclotransferase [Candidatus Nealsonbacteria bacterium]|nr:glutaminyl-peptide cyclotransferase [Candidatus Nealsonbacteria bacterium]
MKRRRQHTGSTIVVLTSICWTLAAPRADAADAPPVYGYEVVATYPHDRRAFCQGLAIEGDVLYEGTGRYGQSTLRRVDLSSGKALKVIRLNGKYFGEGITVWGDSIVQLTWRNQLGFIFDKESLKYRGGFRYSGEGWGVTHDGQHLIVSDGSATLRLLDPKTYRVVKQLTVHDRGTRVDKLNELEYVEGEIFANVWNSDFVLRISPQTGAVIGRVDLSGLLTRLERRNVEAVLNGIAYDPQKKRLFVTGKFWPKLFEIRLVARP